MDMELDIAHRKMLEEFRLGEQNGFFFSIQGICNASHSSRRKISPNNRFKVIIKEMEKTHTHIHMYILIGIFLSSLGVEPRTSHKPSPTLYHLSHASKAFPLIYLQCDHKSELTFKLFFFVIKKILDLNNSKSLKFQREREIEIYFTTILSIKIFTM